MPKEAITERLKFLTEILRLAWISLLAIGGGTIGLLFGPYDLVRVLFAALGIAASIGLGVVIERLTRKMQQLLTQLGER
jgi:hypothetical protein